MQLSIMNFLVLYLCLLKFTYNLNKTKLYYNLNQIIFYCLIVFFFSDKWFNPENLPPKGMNFSILYIFIFIHNIFYLRFRFLINYFLLGIKTVVYLHRHFDLMCLHLLDLKSTFLIYHVSLVDTRLLISKFYYHTVKS